MPVLELASPGWKVVYDSDEEYFELTWASSSNEARLYCPAAEAGQIGLVLTGQEYPMPKRVRELALGLPVVDIGAHVGAASLYFDTLLNSRLYAYEPGQRAIRHLKRNLKQLPEVHAYEKAVTGWDGVCEYFERGEMFLSSCLCPSAPDHQYTVECVSGRAALVPVEGEIGVLKIDAEGSEVQILKSAAHDLSRVRVIYLEWHNERLRRQCDAILEDFTLFYIKGDWLQGVAGYVNNRFARYVHEEWDRANVQRST